MKKQTTIIIMGLTIALSPLTYAIGEEGGTEKGLGERVQKMLGLEQVPEVFTAKQMRKAYEEEEAYQTHMMRMERITAIVNAERNLEEELAKLLRYRAERMAAEAEIQAIKEEMTQQQARHYTFENYVHDGTMQGRFE